MGGSGGNTSEQRNCIWDGLDGLVGPDIGINRDHLASFRLMGIENQRSVEEF